MLLNNVCCGRRRQEERERMPKRKKGDRRKSQVPTHRCVCVLSKLNPAKTKYITVKENITEHLKQRLR